MSRVGILLSTGCAVALVAALVPAVASGTNVAPPSASSSASMDDRKKPRPSKNPKPSKKPKPTKSPTPTPSPSAPVPIQAQTVGEWVDRQWATLDQVVPRYTYFVEPVLEGSHWEAAFKAGAEESFAIHRAFGYPVERDFRVYMGWNDDWLRETIPPNECQGIGPLHPVAQCWGTNVLRANFQSYSQENPEYTPQSRPVPWLRLHITGHLGHELAHGVQEQVSPRYRERMQLADSYWLVEGWAMVIELMTGAKVHDLNYTRAREYKLRAMGSRCLDTDLKDLLYKKSPQACEYLKGMLAMEYLMWKTGDMSAGLTYIVQDTATPHEAFQRAFSLDLNAFMEEADAYADQEIGLWWVRRAIE